MVTLIAALTPTLLTLFQAWATGNPAASDDEAKAELQRLVTSDDDAAAAYADLKAEIEKAKDLPPSPPSLGI